MGARSPKWGPARAAGVLLVLALALGPRAARGLGARGAWGPGAHAIAADSGARARRVRPPLPAAVAVDADRADDAVFVSGTLPTDADGQPVHAHEGHIVVQEDGLFLWFGTGQKRLVDGEWLSDSIHLYTSRDLASWRHKGRVFAAASIPDLTVPPPYRVERVKALYNAERRTYVLLFGLSSLNYSLSAVGYASSVSPYGPYKWEQAAEPDGAPAYDIGVAQDGDGGGAAYLVRSVGENHTAISQLKPDYLGTAGICSSAPHMGAPALFKSGAGAAARWYLLGSRHKRWQGATPLLYVSDGPGLCGAKWARLARPAAGAGADTTFDSTPAFVHTYSWGDGSELQVYVGDRWNLKGEGSVANASYVWLPLLPDGGGGFSMLWLDAWKLGDFKPAAPS